MIPKSMICALAALALSCASVWADTPAEWAPNVPAPSDRLRMDAVSQCVALPENEPVNEGYAAYFTIDSGSPVNTFTAQGLPPGVSIDATTYALKGAPTKPGIYHAVITAINMNKFEFSLVLKFNVGDVEEPEYVDDLYLGETFKEMTVGSALDYGLGMSSTANYSYDGVSYSYTSTFSISGLPAGLKTRTEKHSSPNHTEIMHFANGVATAAGRYLVSATSTYKSVEKGNGKTMTDSWDQSSQVEVIVNGAESKYYTVQVGKGDGTVTGGGCVVAAGKTFNTTATPAKNSVFAGWYADADCTIAADNIYQTRMLGKNGNHGIAAQTWLNGYIHDYNGEPPYSYAPTAPNTLYARFVEKAADTNITITVEVGGVAVNDDSCEIIVDNYNFSWPIDAYSTVAEVVDEKVVFKPGSYTSVTAVKGLPKALYAYVANGEVVGIARDSDFALVPGKYPVAITAKNLSGTTVTKTITLVVENDDGFAFTWGGHGDAWNEKSVTLTLHIGDELTETTGFGITHNYADRIVVSGQPTGLRFSNGVLVGKPTKAGTYTLVAKATSGASGGTMQANVTIVVRDDLTLTVPDADVKYSPIDGVMYLDGLVAVISDSEATLAFKGLPSGVTYDAKNNALKGTAKVEGPATVTVIAKNKSGVTDSADFTLVVPNTKPMVTVVAVYGDESPASDVVTGAGSYEPGKKVTITAKPNKGNFLMAWIVSGVAVYSINGTTLTFTMPDDPALLESGILVKARFATPQDDVLLIDPLPAYADLLTGDGVVSAFLTDYCASAISPLKIAISGLPAGLKYNAKTFEITGTPSKPGSYTVKVTASNSSTSAIVEWILNVPNSDAFGPTFAGTPETIKLHPAGPFEHVFSLAAGYKGYSVAVAGLPAGLKFDKNSGAVSGRPTKAGTYTVTLTATKKGAATQVAVLTFVVDPLPEWLVGTFTGYSAGYDFDEWVNNTPVDYWPYNDLISMTVAKDGKLSGMSTYIDNYYRDDGRINKTGRITKESLGIDSYPAEIDGDGSYIYYGATDDGDDVVITVRREDFGGTTYGSIKLVAQGDDYAEREWLTQNLYTRKPAVEGLFSKTGTLTINFNVLEDDELRQIPGTLTLKFGKNGAVTPTYNYTYGNKKIKGTVIAQPVSVENIVYVHLLGVRDEGDYDSCFDGVIAIELDAGSDKIEVAEMTVIPRLQPK